MAKYDVKCAQCGENMVINLVGPNKEREWRLAHFRGICEKCKERKAAEAAAENAEQGLPQLRGSAKQISWAETIRADVLRFVRVLDEEKYPERLGLLKDMDRAEWWIDRRSYREDQWEIVFDKLTFAGKFTYPGLTGSDRQVKWAEDLRRAAVSEAWGPDAAPDRIQGLLDTMTSATWWIDHYA